MAITGLITDVSVNVASNLLNHGSATVQSISNFAYESIIEHPLMPVEIGTTIATGIISKRSFQAARLHYQNHEMGKAAGCFTVGLVSGGIAVTSFVLAAIQASDILGFSTKEESNNTQESNILFSSSKEGPNSRCISTLSIHPVYGTPHLKVNCEFNN
jgi:hypothetical protein